MADDFAILEARLDQLLELRSRGVGTVEYEGRWVEYRRDSELNAAIQDLERRIHKRTCVMKSFIQQGAVLTVPAPTGGVSSGDVVTIGKLVGVAVTDAAEGDSVAVMVEGVFSVPVAAADDVGVGGDCRARGVAADADKGGTEGAHSGCRVLHACCTRVAQTGADEVGRNVIPLVLHGISKRGRVARSGHEKTR